MSRMVVSGEVGRLSADHFFGLSVPTGGGVWTCCGRDDGLMWVRAERVVCSTTRELSQDFMIEPRLLHRPEVMGQSSFECRFSYDVGVFRS